MAATVLPPPPGQHCLKFFLCKAQILVIPAQPSTMAVLENQLKLLTWAAIAVTCQMMFNENWITAQPSSYQTLIGYVLGNDRNRHGSVVKHKPSVCNSEMKCSLTNPDNSLPVNWRARKTGIIKTPYHMRVSGVRATISSTPGMGSIFRT